MTYITQLTGRKATSILQIMTMMLAGFVLVVLQSSTVHAQWTSNGNNINNTNTGNVGIGTTTPGSPLEVNKSQNAGTTVVVDNGHTAASNGAYSGFFFKQAGANRFFIGSINDGNTTQFGGAGSVQLWNFTNGPTLFATNNVERMRIDAAGKVGIGTTNPLGRLHTVADGASNFFYIDAYGTGNMPLIQARVARGSATAPTGLASGDLVYDIRSQGYDGAAFQNVSIVRTAVDGTVSGGIVPGRLQFYTTNASGTLTEAMRIDRSGNVGIGTASPDINARLHVYNAPSAGMDIQSANAAGWSRLRLVTGTHSYGWFAGDSTQADAPNKIGLYDYTASAFRMMIDSSGNVGIGTSVPSTKLHVVGDGTITGNLTVTGNIASKYQDVAEWVQSSQELSAGTVVVLDQTKSNQVIASSQAYDTRVAGVISLQPGITLGEKGEGKVLVATTGRVRIKVDASRGSIKIGDLLVTSDVAGVAMKSQPIDVGGVQIHRPGTLIGKALEPLEKGVGEILVLLSLQ